jgi:sugar lactone lactonase YvrE
VAPGFKVWIWASVPDPVDLTAGSDGALYAGRDLSGSGGGNGAPTPIERISATAEVTPFGPALSDPDTVWFDAAGLASPAPGSVLVGGRDDGITPLQGRVTAVAPDQAPSVVFGPSTLLINPAGLALDSAGRLLITDFDNGNVAAVVGGVPTVLIDGPAFGPIDVVVHPVSGDLYVSWNDGSVRRYTAGGLQLDGSFTIGRALEFGPGNATFGSDLYSVDNTTGTLRRTDAAKNVTVLGSGFQDVRGLTFGVDGALYVTEFARDRVMRVSCLPEPGEVADLMLAKANGGSSLGFTWSDVAAATDYVVFQSASPAGPFVSQTGSASSGVSGLTAPMPPGNLLFFQVGGRDRCGVGMLN